MRSLGFIVALSAFMSTASLAEPIRVAVIEVGQVDYQNPNLREVLDFEAMSKIEVPDENGELKTLLQLERWEVPKSPIYKEWSDFQDTLMASEAYRKLPLLKKLMQFPSEAFNLFRLYHNKEEVRRLNEDTHKTSVSSIMVAGLNDVRLITLGYSDRTLRTGHTDELAAEARRISEILRALDVRVVNLSFGLIYSEHGIANAEIQNWKYIFERNPQAVFVFAAANDGQKVGADGFYKLLREMPNVLIVASVDSQAKIAERSGRSAEIIQIAARGEDVTAARAGGGLIRVSGSSYAAPAVGRALARIIQRHPGMSGEVAVRSLFAYDIDYSIALAPYVEAGRYLRDCSDLLLGRD